MAPDGPNIGPNGCHVNVVFAGDDTVGDGPNMTTSYLSTVCPTGWTHVGVAETGRPPNISWKRNNDQNPCGLFNSGRNGLAGLRWAEKLLPRGQEGTRRVV